MRVIVFSLLLAAGTESRPESFANPQREPSPPSAASIYRDDLRESAWEVFGLRAPVSTLAAQAQVESGWRSDARSPVGALGLLQFMPATANDMAARFGRCAPANPLDAKWSIRCSHLYMRELLRSIDAPECAQWEFGFRAYNGGLRWIERDRTKTRLAGKDANDPRQVELFNAGRRASAFNENVHYPLRILAVDDRYYEAGWGPRVCSENSSPRSP